MAREPKDVEETEDENPLTAIMERAESLGLEDDEFDDYVEKRMERKGYKRGPGDWIPIESDDDEDDEDDEDDDDTPVTRGDIRRMRRSQGRNRRASISSPPRKKREKAKENGRETRSRRDPWWE